LENQFIVNHQNVPKSPNKWSGSRKSI